MKERDRKAAIRAAMRNPQPAIRNQIRPVAETVRAPIIAPKPTTQQFEVADDRDRSCRVFVTKEGEYYPGRMQQPTLWQHLRIEFEGETIECWRGTSWGYDGDWGVLKFQCSDIEDIEEWWGDEEEEYDFEFITPGCPGERKFRHVADVLAELKREGSVDIW